MQNKKSSELLKYYNDLVVGIKYWVFAENSTQRYYPAGIVEKYPYLSREHRFLEAAFAERVETQLNEILAEYHNLARAQKGFSNYIDVDLARALFYFDQTSLGHLTLHNSTSNPAKALAAKAYFRTLQDENKDDVVLIIGGSASGKSRLGDQIQSLHDKPIKVVFETTLDDERKANSIIGSALNFGQNVTLYYVHCPFEITVERALQRMHETGRIVRLPRMAGLYKAYPEVLLHFQEKYKEQLDFRAFLNEKTLGDLQSVTLEKLNQILKQDSRSFDELKKNGIQIAEDQRNLGELSNLEYREFKKGGKISSMSSKGKVFSRKNLCQSLR